MSDGKIVGRQINALDVLVDERRVGIVDVLAVAMVLHHDHEYMIQSRDAFRNRPLIRPRGGCQERSESKRSDAALRHDADASG